MISARAKNIVIIVIVSVLAAAIIAGSIYVAVDGNRKNEEREYFFDVAPINYGTNESFAYAKMFRDAVASYFKTVSNTIDISSFADRCLNVMSVSRIPPERLKSVSSALKKHSLQELLDAVDLDKFDVDSLEQPDVNAITAVGKFLDDFYKETELTPEEAGTALYNYLDLYASDGYKKSLYEVGREPFIKLFAVTTYFLSAIPDVEAGVGAYADSSALRAALYEAGAVFVDTSAKFADFERVYGLAWHYTDIEYAKELNLLLSNLSGKTASLFSLFGYVLKEIDSENIDYLRNYADDGGEEAYILSRGSLALSVGRGLKKLLSVDKTFGETPDEACASLKFYVKNLYGARAISAGLDPEILDRPDFDLFDESYKIIDGFFEATAFFEANGLNAEDINGDKKAEYLDAAAKFEEAGKVGGGIISAVVYMWVSQRIFDAQKEI